MLAVEDHRAVFQLRLHHHLLFLHVHHVAVAIVVVAHVVLVEPRHGADFVLGAQILPVPVHHHVLPVGIERGPQHQDDVVENRVDLRIVLRGEQLVGQHHGVLRAGHFVGVQAAIDVHDHLGRARQFLRLVVVQIGGVGQSSGNLFGLVQLGQVLRRRDDGDLDVLAFGGLAHGEHLDAVRGRGQRVEVANRVFVVGEVEVVAGIVPENGDRRRHLCARSNAGNKGKTAGSDAH